VPQRTPTLPRVSAGPYRERIARRVRRSRAPSCAASRKPRSIFEASISELLDVATRLARQPLCWVTFARIMTGFLHVFLTAWLAAEARCNLGCGGEASVTVQFVPGFYRGCRALPRANIVKHVVAVGSAEFTA